MSYTFEIKKELSTVDVYSYMVSWELKCDDENFLKRLKNIFEGRDLIIKRENRLLIKIGLNPIILKFDYLSSGDKSVSSEPYNPFNKWYRGDINFENPLYANSFVEQLGNLFDPLLKTQYAEYEALLDKKRQGFLF